VWYGLLVWYIVKVSELGQSKVQTTNCSTSNNSLEKAMSSSINQLYSYSYIFSSGLYVADGCVILLLSDGQGLVTALYQCQVS
jgi:hypothetical protein